jgi:tRNA (guanine-N7-)-methyltransferase
VLQFPEQSKDKWQTIFGNYNPIVLELACGKGEYTVNMAKAFPDKNFIGIDIKGNRMYVGAKMALQQEISNVRFLRIRIEQILDYFNQQSIAEIWITFPDPFLRESKAKNRLTHHKFLTMYQSILVENGLIHLKTDSKELFDFNNVVQALIMLFLKLRPVPLTETQTLLLTPEPRNVLLKRLQFKPVPARNPLLRRLPDF